MRGRQLWFWLGVVSAGLPAGAGAQTLSYDTPASEGAEGTAGNRVSGGSGADDALPGTGRRGGGERVRLVPYIEATQVLNAQVSPGNDLVTWTALAAGLDGGLRGRSHEGSVSVRYERRVGWGREPDSDALSGLARAGVTVIPGAVSLEGGVLATRTSTDITGANLPERFDRRNSGHLYSLYAGPSLRTRLADLTVKGAYRFGYTEVGASSPAVAGTSVPSGDRFDRSWVHDASFHGGVRPGELLPVGLGVGGGVFQEDISNLDQRVRDVHARADLTLPVGSSLALVGGVGFEDVEVSSRDALRDSGGVPLIGADGRYVTDKGAPRRIAYDTSGLIWDAGVTWRPSRDTALEAHVGWRYGGTTWYGAFGWKPSRRSMVNLSVYDSISGVGGQINRALAGLPREFVVQRDAISGDLNGCVTTLEPGGCLTGAFGALRAATFRSRGIQGSYALDFGRYGAGIAAGHDERQFIAAPGTILAAANGVVDETTWLSAWFNARIARRTGFSSAVYANRFSSGLSPFGSGTALGASAALQHAFDNHLSANAAVSLAGIQRKLIDDIWNASALVGVRYSF